MKDSRQATEAHINLVRHYIYWFIHELSLRALEHDESKLESPEKEIFDKLNGGLNEFTYGSDEYHAKIQQLGVALEHHYQHNRHHPEHHAGGIDGMDLIDLVEMFFDWVAATQKHDDGNISSSLIINEERFSVSPQITCVFRNTAKTMGLINDDTKINETTITGC